MKYIERKEGDIVAVFNHPNDRVNDQIKDDDPELLAFYQSL